MKSEISATGKVLFLYLLVVLSLLLNLQWDNNATVISLGYRPFTDQRALEYNGGNCLIEEEDELIDSLLRAPRNIKLPITTVE